MQEFSYPIPPMEPVLSASPPQGSYIAQIKWDGVRCMFFKAGGSALLFNRRQRPRTGNYPEIAGALAYLPDGTALDGEMIVMDTSGPSFSRVLKRDLARSANEALISQYPVSYMVFDILYLDGECLFSLPIEERLRLLEGILPKGGPVFFCSAEGDAAALFAAAEKNGLEGIVVKKAGSPYLPGKKTPLWQKIKVTRQEEAAVFGYCEDGSGAPRSLITGMIEEGRPVYTGKAGSGLSSGFRGALTELKSLPRTPCPFTPDPKLEGAIWVEPVMKTTVKYLERSDAGLFRNPVIMKLEAVK